MEKIVERLRSARLVCSGETSARLNGRNQWEWVFQNEQVCLHVIRPSRGKAVIDAGDDLFAPRMKCLLLRAIAVNRRRHQLAESTLGQYRSRFRGSLREILNLKSKSPEGQRLLNRYQRIQEHLLLFLDDETMPPTNNSSEQALRWSVVFRKVTHGFRSDWGAELFA